MPGHTASTTFEHCDGIQSDVQLWLGRAKKVNVLNSGGSATTLNHSQPLQRRWCWWLGMVDKGQEWQPERLVNGLQLFSIKVNYREVERSGG